MAGASLYGASQQASAAKSAAAQQAAAQAQAVALQTKIYDEAAPEREAGHRAITRLEDLLRGDSRDRARVSGNAQLRDLNSALGSTGNARSGQAAELSALALMQNEAQYRAEEAQGNLALAEIGGTAGARADAAATGLQPTIQQAADNRSNLTLAQGGVKAGMADSLGQLPLQALTMASLFGGGGSAGTPMATPTSSLEPLTLTQPGGQGLAMGGKIPGLNMLGGRY